MFEDNKTQVTTKSAQEVYDALALVIADGHGDEPFYIGVPYRNGIGLHYEGVVEITSHSGIIDLCITTPDSDDVKEKK